MLKRVFDINMQRCPNCGGGELKIIAAILEQPVIEKILTHRALNSPEERPLRGGNLGAVNVAEGSPAGPR